MTGGGGMCSTVQYSVIQYIPMQCSLLHCSAMLNISEQRMISLDMPPSQRLQTDLIAAMAKTRANCIEVFTQVEQCFIREAIL